MVVKAGPGAVNDGGSGQSAQGTVALADAKSKQPAPVYVDWFAWQPPLFDGRMGAFHCLDICFWFSNTDLMLTHTSDQHPWFLASASGPASPKRDWYVWSAEDPHSKVPWGNDKVWLPS